MKNIYVLAASPRKHGNSDILCDAFMEGAIHAGHCVEKVYVCEEEIAYCCGCGVCQATHVCVRQDAMTKIMEKMIAADVIVFATPVYFYNMSAQLKTLLDRTTPRYTELSGKEFYILLSAADEDKTMVKHVVDSFQGYFDCLEDATLKGVVYGLNAYEVGEIHGNIALEEAFSLGKHC